MWYRPTLPFYLYPFIPLSLVFIIISKLRRQYLMARQTKLPVPVIIVGNITVGGTGKTPVVVEIVNYLQQKGLRPGIITRGYKINDEPKLLAKRTKVPVVIDKDRVAAGETLLANNPEINIIIADDGLQHYKLARDFEIAVIGQRRFGNGWCLPLGPLREMPSRLKMVDLIIDKFKVIPKQIINLSDSNKVLAANIKVHAVAGIGYPTKFFTLLASLGFDIIEHEFMDHHAYRQDDLEFQDDLPIVMTEKDAVKCQEFATEKFWYLPIDVKLPTKCYERIDLWIENY